MVTHQSLQCLLVSSRCQQPGSGTAVDCGSTSWLPLLPHPGKVHKPAPTAAQHCCCVSTVAQWHGAHSHWHSNEDDWLSLRTACSGQRVDVQNSLMLKCPWWHTFSTPAISAERHCSLLALSEGHPCSHASCQPLSDTLTGSSFRSLSTAMHCSTADTSATLNCCSSCAVRPPAHTTRNGTDCITRTRAAAAPFASSDCRRENRLGAG